MAEGDITILVSPEGGGAVIPHELAHEREQRLQAQQALASARLQQLETARLAARNSAHAVENQRQAAMARIKTNLEEGNYDEVSKAQAELADLAVRHSQWEEYAAQIEQSGNIEQQREAWLAKQHKNHVAWVRAHPEFWSDPDFQKRAVAFSGEAVQRGYQADDPRHHKFVEERLGLRQGGESEYHGAAVQVSSRQSPAGPATHVSQRQGGVDDPREPQSLEPRRPVYAAPPNGSGRDFSGQRSFIDGSTTAHLSAEEANLARYMFPDVSESQALVKYAHNKKILQAEGKLEKRRGDY